MNYREKSPGMQLLHCLKVNNNKIIAKKKLLALKTECLIVFKQVCGLEI